MEVSFEETLGCTGVLHIIHNAFNYFVESVPELDSAVDGLPCVGKMLREEHTLQRLLERSYNDPWGRAQHK